MDVGGPYPFRAVAAYAPATPSVAGARASQVLPPASAKSVVSTTGLDRLVAGRVSGGLDFEPAAVRPLPARSAFPLYTNAAARMEAATGVARGRFIDVEA